MTETIVVPLDGSELAERALGPARALAERSDAALLLLTTHWADRTGGAPEYLERAAAGAGYARTRTVVVRDRFAPEAIALEAEQPDRIVCMATHGRSGLGQAVLGSVAEEVLGKVHAPVVLVGPGLERDAWGSAHWFEGGRIVVALDGSPAATVAIPVATEWSDRLRLPLELVRVLLLPLGLGRAGPESAEARAGLEELAARLTAAHGSPTCTVLAGVDPATALVEHVRARPTTLVVMTTHGRTGVARWALGSVAMQMVHRSPCPVLVVRSP